MLLFSPELIAGISNGAKIVPFDCALSDKGSTPKSVRALWLRVLFPMMLLVVYWFLCIVFWLLVRRKQRLGNLARMATFNTLLTYMIIVTITVVFFAYNSVTEELMRTVNCIDADKDEHLENEPFGLYAAALNDEYWAEDTSLTCFKGDHALTGVFGILGLLFFSTGFVVFIIVWLTLHQDALTDARFVTRYGFIYRAYRKGKIGSYQTGGDPQMGRDAKLLAVLAKITVYWEAIITTRKGLISAAVVFAYTLGGNLQGVLALGVLILALALQLLFRPFRKFPCFNTRKGMYRHQKTIDDSIDLNHLESFSLFVSTVTFYSGIVFNDPNTSDAGTIVMAVFVFIVNILLVSYFLYRIFEGTHILVDLKLTDFKVQFDRCGWLIVKFVKLVRAYVSATRQIAITGRSKKPSSSTTNGDSPNNGSRNCGVASVPVVTKVRDQEKTSSKKMEGQHGKGNMSDLEGQLQPA